jgi:hypothetical protein
MREKATATSSTCFHNLIVAKGLETARGVSARGKRDLLVGENWALAFFAFSV